MPVKYEGRQISISQSNKSLDVNVVYTRPEDVIKLSFPLSDAKITFLNGDIDFIFKNGSVISLASFATLAFSQNAPIVYDSQGKVINITDLLEKAEQIDPTKEVLILANRDEQVLVKNDDDVSEIIEATAQSGTLAGGNPIAGKGNVAQETEGRESSFVDPSGLVDFDDKLQDNTDIYPYTSNISNITGRTNSLKTDIGNIVVPTKPKVSQKFWFGSYIQKTGSTDLTKSDGTVEQADYYSTKFNAQTSTDSSVQLDPIAVNIHNSKAKFIDAHSSDGRVMKIWQFNYAGGVFPQQITIKNLPDDVALTIQSGTAGITLVDGNYIITRLDPSGSIRLGFSFDGLLPSRTLSVEYDVQYVDSRTGDIEIEDNFTTIKVDKISSKNDLTSADSVLNSIGAGLSVSKGSEDAIIVGGFVENIITSSGGSNLIFTGGGRDTIKLGGGDDVIYGSLGYDIIDGGGGNDTLVFNNDKSFTNFSSSKIKDVDYDTMLSSGGNNFYIGVSNISRDWDLRDINGYPDGFREAASGAHNYAVNLSSISIIERVNHIVGTNLRDVFTLKFEVSENLKLEGGSLRNTLKVEGDFSVVFNVSNLTISKDSSVYYTYVSNEKSVFNKVVGGDGDDTFEFGSIDGSNFLGLVSYDGANGSNRLDFSNLNSRASIAYDAASGGLIKYTDLGLASGVSKNDDMGLNIQKVKATNNNDTFYGTSVSVANIAESIEFDGGSGDDTADYGRSLAGVTYEVTGATHLYDGKVYKTSNYLSSISEIRAAKYDTLTNIETVKLTNQDDVILTSDIASRTYEGAGGFDVINYSEQSDYAIKVNTDDASNVTVTNLPSPTTSDHLKNIEGFIGANKEGNVFLVGNFNNKYYFDGTTNANNVLDYRAIISGELHISIDLTSGSVLKIGSAFSNTDNYTNIQKIYGTQNNDFFFLGSFNATLSTDIAKLSSLSLDGAGGDEDTFSLATVHSDSSTYATSGANYMTLTLASSGAVRLSFAEAPSTTIDMKIGNIYSILTSRYNDTIDISTFNDTANTWTVNGVSSIINASSSVYGDTVSWAGSSSAGVMSVSSSNNYQLAYNGGKINLININHFVGGDGDDVFVANYLGSDISPKNYEGGAGDDTLQFGTVNASTKIMLGGSLSGSINFNPLVGGSTVVNKFSQIEKIQTGNNNIVFDMFNNSINLTYIVNKGSSALVTLDFTHSTNTAIGEINLNATQTATAYNFAGLLDNGIKFFRINSFVMTAANDLLNVTDDGNTGLSIDGGDGDDTLSYKSTLYSLYGFDVELSTGVITRTNNLDTKAIDTIKSIETLNLNNAQNDTVKISESNLKSIKKVDAGATSTGDLLDLSRFTNAIASDVLSLDVYRDSLKNATGSSLYNTSGSSIEFDNFNIIQASINANNQFNLRKANSVDSNLIIRGNVGGSSRYTSTVVLNDDDSDGMTFVDLTPAEASSMSSAYAAPSIYASGRLSWGDISTSTNRAELHLQNGIDILKINAVAGQHYDILASISKSIHYEAYITGSTAGTEVSLHYDWMNIATIGAVASNLEINLTTSTITPLSNSAYSNTYNEGFTDIYAGGGDDIFKVDNAFNLPDSSSTSAITYHGEGGNDILDFSGDKANTLDFNAVGSTTSASSSVSFTVDTLSSSATKTINVSGITKVVLTGGDDKLRIGAIGTSEGFLFDEIDGGDNKSTSHNTVFITSNDIIFNGVTQTIAVGAKTLIIDNFQEIQADKAKTNTFNGSYNFDTFYNVKDSSDGSGQTLSYSARLFGVSVNIGEGSVSKGSSKKDYFAGVQDIIGSSYSNNTFYLAMNKGELTSGGSIMGGSEAKTLATYNINGGSSLYSNKASIAKLGNDVNFDIVNSNVYKGLTSTTSTISYTLRNINVYEIASNQSMLVAWDNASIATASLITTNGSSNTALKINETSLANTKDVIFDASNGEITSRYSASTINDASGTTGYITKSQISFFQFSTLTGSTSNDLFYGAAQSYNFEGGGAIVGTGSKGDVISYENLVAGGVHFLFTGDLGHAKVSKTSFVGAGQDDLKGFSTFRGSDRDDIFDIKESTTAGSSTIPAPNIDGGAGTDTINYGGITLPSDDINGLKLTADSTGSASVIAIKATTTTIPDYNATSIEQYFLSNKSDVIQGSLRSSSALAFDSLRSSRVDRPNKKMGDLLDYSTSLHDILNAGGTLATDVSISLDFGHQSLLRSYNGVTAADRFNGDGLQTFFLPGAAYNSSGYNVYNTVKFTPSQVDLWKDAYITTYIPAETYNGIAFNGQIFDTTNSLLNILDFSGITSSSSLNISWSFNSTTHTTEVTGTAAVGATSANINSFGFNAATLGAGDDTLTLSATALEVINPDYGLKGGSGNNTLKLTNIDMTSASSYELDFANPNRHILLHNTSSVIINEFDTFVLVGSTSSGDTIPNFHYIAGSGGHTISYGENDSTNVENAVFDKAHNTLKSNVGSVADYNATIAGGVLIDFSTHNINSNGYIRNITVATISASPSNRTDDILNGFTGYKLTNDSDTARINDLQLSTSTAHKLSIDAGEGLDTIDLSGFTKAAIINIENNAVHYARTNFNTYNFERYSLTNFNDTLTFTGANTLGVQILGGSIAAGGYNSVDYSPTTDPDKENLVVREKTTSLSSTGGVVVWTNDLQVTRNGYTDTLNGFSDIKLTSGSNEYYATYTSNQELGTTSYKDAQVIDGAAGIDTINYSAITGLKSQVTISKDSLIYKRSVAAGSHNISDTLKNFEVIVGATTDESSVIFSGSAFDRTTDVPSLDLTRSSKVTVSFDSIFSMLSTGLKTIEYRFNAASIKTLDSLNIHAHNSSGGSVGGDKIPTLSGYISTINGFSFTAPGQHNDFKFLGSSSISQNQSININGATGNHGQDVLNVAQVVIANNMIYSISIFDSTTQDFHGNLAAGKFSVLYKNIGVIRGSTLAPDTYNVSYGGVNPSSVRSYSVIDSFESNNSLVANTTTGSIAWNSSSDKVELKSIAVTSGSAHGHFTLQMGGDRSIVSYTGINFVTFNSLSFANNPSERIINVVWNSSAHINYDITNNSTYTVKLDMTSVGVGTSVTLNNSDLIYQNSADSKDSLDLHITSTSKVDIDDANHMLVNIRGENEILGTSGLIQINYAREVDVSGYNYLSNAATSDDERALLLSTDSDNLTMTLGQIHFKFGASVPSMNIELGAQQVIIKLDSSFTMTSASYKTINFNGSGHDKAHAPVVDVSSFDSANDNVTVTTERDHLNIRLTNTSSGSNSMNINAYDTSGVVAAQNLSAMVDRTFKAVLTEDYLSYDKFAGTNSASTYFGTKFVTGGGTSLSLLGLGTSSGNALHTVIDFSDFNSTQALNVDFTHSYYVQGSKYYGGLRISLYKTTENDSIFSNDSAARSHQTYPKIPITHNIYTGNSQNTIHLDLTILKNQGADGNYGELTVHVTPKAGYTGGSNVISLYNSYTSDTYTVNIHAVTPSSGGINQYTFQIEGHGVSEYQIDKVSSVIGLSGGHTFNFTFDQNTALQGVTLDGSLVTNHNSTFKFDSSFDYNNLGLGSSLYISLNAYDVTQANLNNMLGVKSSLTFKSFKELDFQGTGLDTTSIYSTAITVDIKTLPTFNSMSIFLPNATTDILSNTSPIDHIPLNTLNLKSISSEIKLTIDFQANGIELLSFRNNGTSAHNGIGASHTKLLNVEGANYIEMGFATNTNFTVLNMKDGAHSYVFLSRPFSDYIVYTTQADGDRTAEGIKHGSVNITNIQTTGHKKIILVSKQDNTGSNINHDIFDGSNIVSHLIYDLYNTGIAVKGDKGSVAEVTYNIGSDREDSSSEAKDGGQIYNFINDNININLSVLNKFDNKAVVLADHSHSLNLFANSGRSFYVAHIEDDGFQIAGNNTDMYNFGVDGHHIEGYYVVIDPTTHNYFYVAGENLEDSLFNSIMGSHTMANLKNYSALDSYIDGLAKKSYDDSINTNTSGSYHSQQGITHKNDSYAYNHSGKDVSDIIDHNHNDANVNNNHLHHSDTSDQKSDLTYKSFANLNSSDNNAHESSDQLSNHELNTESLNVLHEDSFDQTSLNHIKLGDVLDYSSMNSDLNNVTKDQLQGLDHSLSKEDDAHDTNISESISVISDAEHTDLDHDYTLTDLEESGADFNNNMDSIKDALHKHISANTGADR